MKQSRTANSVRNIFWALTYKIIIMLLPFVVRSVMIYKLGVEYTGLSSLFTSLLTMLTLAELGFSSAMVYCMYEPIHKGDYETICSLLNLYRKIYTIIGAIILVVGLILLPFLPYLVHNDAPTDINIYTLYLIYLANTVVSYFMFAYKSSLLTAYQRNDIISIIGMISNICLYGLQIIVLLVTGSIYLYAVLLPISTVVINIGYHVMTQRLYPELRSKGKVEPELKEKIKKRVIGIMLYKFSSTTRTSFDSVIISSFLGLAILTQYQNYFMIISSVLGVLALINNSITASVGDSIVDRDVESNYADFKKFVFIYMWVAGWFTICIVCLIQPFMRLWMSEKLMLSGTMALLFSIYFYAQTMGNMVFLYRSAAGLWWQDRVRPVVEAVANIVLNILLVKLWGIHGVILATIITLIGINFLWGARILFKYYFKCSLKRYLVMQGKQMIITIFTAAISLFICNLLLGQGIITFISKIIICVILPNIMFFLCYRRDPLFNQAKIFVIKILNMFLKRKK